MKKAATFFILLVIIILLFGFVFLKISSGGPEGNSLGTTREKEIGEFYMLLSPASWKAVRNDLDRH